MEVTYSWVFDNLDCYTSYSGKTNVVFNVLWKLIATTTIEEYNNPTGTTYYTYSADTVGKQNIFFEESTTFVPFENLTKQIVQEWVENSIGTPHVNNLKDILKKNIEDQINPPTVELTPPWS